MMRSARATAASVAERVLRIDGRATPGRESAADDRYRKNQQPRSLFPPHEKSITQAAKSRAAIGAL